MGLEYHWEQALVFWVPPDCWGFQGEIEDLRRSFKYMLLSNKLQLDYWTELGLVPFLVL
jgi:hypothetical protein